MDTTPYEDLLAFAGDYRVKLATETTILYDRFGQAKYPIATTDAKIAGVPEDGWVEDDMQYLHCDFHTCPLRRHHGRLSVPPP
jgi:hypothetical protein